MKRITQIKYWEYVALFIIYIAIRIPDIWAIEEFAVLIFPLNFLYYAKLLFSGVAVNPAISDTIIAPSNASLIYPPGIYILSSVLGSVRNTFYFLFAIQAVIPLLVFRFLHPVAPRIVAFSVAILIVFFCTSAHYWYPDFIIQPIMAGVLIFNLTRNCKIKPLELVMCGVGSGLVFLLKHNIGIFFIVLCGTVIFFRSSRFSEEKSNRIPAYFVLTGFFGFGLLFFTKLPHIDEIVFYLLPYFAFWIYILLLFYKRQLHLDSIGFLRQGALYASAAMTMPLITFMYFGEVIGFKRYWHSLFGMGIDYIHFWDTGIVAIARAYAQFTSIGAAYMSLILLTTILGPLLINLIGVGILYYGRDDNNQKKLDRILAVSIGVMAVFMLFPLEDHKIAVTKFFIFSYVFVVLLRNVSALTWRILSCSVLLMLLPVFLSTWHHLQLMTKIPAVAGTKEMQRVIGLPLHKDLAQELGLQIKVLQRSIRGSAYIALSTPRYNLMGLPILVDNVRPQYYVRFDSEAISKDVIKATISELEKVQYLIVPTGDYQDYKDGKMESNAFKDLMTYVTRECVVIDEYVESVGGVGVKHINSFMVFKKKL